MSGEAISAHTVIADNDVPSLNPKRRGGWFKTCLDISGMLK